jgi:hypothetical protein
MEPRKRRELQATPLSNPRFSDFLDMKRKIKIIGCLQNHQSNLLFHNFKSSTNNQQSFPSKETLKNINTKETEHHKTEKIM